MEAAELSSRGLARRLRVDNRMLRRWRKKGTQPDPGHLVVALFTLAIEMGLLHILPAVREPKDERSFLFAIVAMFKVRIFNGTH